MSNLEPLERIRVRERGVGAGEDDACWIAATPSVAVRLRRSTSSWRTCRRPARSRSAARSTRPACSMRGARPRRHHRLGRQPCPGRRLCRAHGEGAGHRRDAGAGRLQSRSTGDRATARGVILRGRDNGEAYGRRRGRGARGLTFVHAFDDHEVIAGQGTLGLSCSSSFPRSTRSSCPWAAAACWPGLCALRGRRHAGAVVAVQAAGAASLRPQPAPASASSSSGRHHRRRPGDARRRRAALPIIRAAVDDDGRGLRRRDRRRRAAPARARQDRGRGRRRRRPRRLPGRRLPARRARLR